MLSNSDKPLSSYLENLEKYYSTPEIDGIKYSKGDIIWIKPLNDSRWQIE